MSKYIFIKIRIAILFLVFSISSFAQTVNRNNPTWWFGLSGAASMNYFRGTTQSLDASLLVPNAFHKGISTRPYVSLLTEYRPNKVVGLMLNVAFDNRGGVFDEVIAPCNCPANLSTNLSYIAIEPSLRIAPFKSSFYIYAGPTFNIIVNKQFIYTQFNQPAIHSDWSAVRKNVVSAQAGLGFDIPLSAKLSETQMTLSPFASFQTDLFQSPRTIENLSIYSVRVGVALKFGYRKVKNKLTDPLIINSIIVKKEKDVQFSVRAPKLIPLSRQMKETFPLRNYVFFEMGSTQIASRYVLLDKKQAKDFTEAQLQEGQPNNLYQGRSTRQLEVYHNILNIIGDRMRSNPNTSITLTGSSDKNPVEGKVMAERIKEYLVVNYEINPNNIKTEGRDKPLIPSEQPGAVSNLELLHEGDRRVDIESNSTALLVQVGGENTKELKPIQIFATQKDPLDSHVIFNTLGATELLTAWSVMLTDEKGNIQHYGPFTEDMASIPGNTILGDQMQGNYTILLVGVTKEGKEIQKTSTVSLIKANSPIQEGLRYSILFDFDKATTVSAYENFLKEIVTPLIPENATVLIHGHTDIIGDVKYNMVLSEDRAVGVREILKTSLMKAGKNNIKFDTYGYGEDTNMAPFENKSPEERFYNRTVIIDILPNK